MSSFRTSATLALLLSSLLPACASDAAQDDGCDDACESGSGEGDATAGPDDGPDPDGGSSDDGEPAGPAVPCEIQELLREHCGDCHADARTAAGQAADMTAPGWAGSSRPPRRVS